MLFVKHKQHYGFAEMCKDLKIGCQDLDFSGILTTSWNLEHTFVAIPEIDEQIPENGVSEKDIYAASDIL
jgi:hypothetical protein